MTYRDFSEQVEENEIHKRLQALCFIQMYCECLSLSLQIERPVCKVSVVYVLSGILRVCVWWCLAEFMIHFMYMHAIQSNETYLEMLPPWALGKFVAAYEFMNFIVYTEFYEECLNLHS